MNRIKCSLSVFFLLSGLLQSITGYSQSLSDALRFSQQINGGTARSTAMGGAFGALGADFTGTTINPGGLGVYQSGEFTFTPSYKRQSISSTFANSKYSDSKNKIAIDNLGLVISFKPNLGKENGIVGINLGFGYSRTNDFNGNALASGNNSTSSIMDYFALSANGIDYNKLFKEDNQDPFTESGAPWDVILAWNTYLIDTAQGGNGTQYVSMLYDTDGVVQKNAISTKGSSGTFDLSFALNISNKFYIGASMGISDFSYTYNATYSEDAFGSNPTLPNNVRFNYSDYSQYYETKGTGFNVKLGCIYTPIRSIRIGAAIHTPTFYSFDDSYSYTMKSSISINGAENNFSLSSPYGKYDYRFETPLKVIGSFAYIYKQFGLISIDIERLDYSSMRFSEGGDGSSYTNLNQDIGTVFKNVTNIRIGGEIRLKDISLRGGYAFYPSPISSSYLNSKADIKQLSGGIGYRIGNTSIDLAYLYTFQDGEYKFYNHDALSPVSTRTTSGKLLVTAGFRF